MIPKRLFWLGVGAVAGAGGTVFGQRKVRRQLDRLGPEHLVTVAEQKARQVGRNVVGTVSDAVAEGRAAARQRESELRSGQGF